MKLKLCKRLLVLSLSCAILATNTIGAQANPKFSKTATTFDKAWEKAVSIYYGSGTEALVGVMVYGYDTFLVNEDYVWTQSLSYNARPIVTNKQGTFIGDWKKGSSGYSKKEVAHQTKETKVKLRK